jgi:murein DD-endopeptidase MepM/ murein hydrolase activator NlpD
MRIATAGSKVKLTGRHLSDVVTVKFNAAGGGRIGVDPIRAGARAVTALVPDGADTGRPRVRDSIDNDSTSPNRLELVGPDAIPEGGAFSLAKANADPAKAFWRSHRKAHVRYSFEGDATDIRIQVVNTDKGKVVASWVEDGQQPYVVHRATWNGLKDSGGEPPNGRYKFRIGPATGGAGETTGASSFDFYDHIFPVRGRHSYGDGFGAPRAGHTHMGQDVMARCGKKLVAARAGRVQWKDYQSAAGNYVVIDAKHDNHDYMYAHLKRPASVHEGERVKTGEPIGEVGSTGDATACHLHFEYWKSDWYNGGRALSSVTRVLKRWDRWS